MNYPTIQQVEANTSVEQALRWYRFLPSPKAAQVDVLNAVIKRLGELRPQDNTAYVEASKSIGWDA